MLFILQFFESIALRSNLLPIAIGRNKTQFKLQSRNNEVRITKFLGGISDTARRESSTSLLQTSSPPLPLSQHNSHLRSWKQE